MSLDAYNLDDSIQPIEIQIPVFSEMVRNITENYGNVTLVGHSQGAFIARAILQTSGNPHIHTLISVAASGKLRKYRFMYSNSGFKKTVSSI